MTTNYSYILPDEKTKIIFSQTVLKHIYSNIQNKIYLPEAGGQIFSKNPDEANIIINGITGPYLTDRRSRYGWVPDIKQMSFDREYLFNKGLYIMGLWHTHPEPRPTPSRKDQITCEKHLQMLDPVYKGFFLITAGNTDQRFMLSVEYLERKSHSWYKLKTI